MAVDTEYLVTETPLIINDYQGDKYSILPVGVALYPIIGSDNAENEYVIYLNYQALPDELESLPHTVDSQIINELYLSNPPTNLKLKDNKFITRNDLVQLLQKSTITKQEFAEVIAELDE